MNHVAQTSAKEYAPTTDEARAAAAAFVTSVTYWGERYKSAQTALRDFVRANVGEPRGFVSRDHLNMSVFSLVFDKAPGAGFIAVPAQVATALQEQGLRGTAYFPDTNHPLGKQVMGLMNAVSRVASQRPLLNSVPGVSSVAIEGRRVVLSRALVAANGDVVVKAAPSALSLAAQVELIQAREAASAATVDATRPARAMRM